MFRYLLTSCLCGLLTSGLFAQLQLKLEPLPDWATWGVYVKPCSNLTPTNNTITGSGQVTIVFPIGQTFTDFLPHAGTWNVNAVVNGPDEAPDRTYVSVGFLIDNPKIFYHPSDETLLFSFKILGDEPPYLMENGVDPFDQLPNSENTNPGNELSVIDFGITPTGFYVYSGNYTGNETLCDGTVPQDSTVTNPQDSTIVTNPQDSTGAGDSTIVVNPQDSTGQGGNTTGVFDFKQTKTVFTLSPNPATDWVSVIFNEGAETGGVIRLWSTHGAELGMLERGQGDVLRLNVEGLSAGLYFLTYEKNGRLIQRGRLVKQ